MSAMLDIFSKGAKASFVRMLRRILANTEIQDILHEISRQPPRGHIHLNSKDLLSGVPPYQGLGKNQLEAKLSRWSNPIFITARFRSGSTLIWNLFRHLSGVTAYYEPLNERKWFDPVTR